MKNYECIDFDNAFSHFLQKWYEKHFGQFRTYDEMEEHVPDAYQEYLETPADFLNGQKPGLYFEQFSDPDALVEWLTEYIRQDVCVPDMLLNRIADLGEQAAPALYRTLQQNGQPDELRMHLVSLLRETASSLPWPLYVQWIAQWDGHNELTENAVESLESDDSDDDRLPELIREAYGKATPHGKAAFLSIYSRHRRDSGMLHEAMALFRDYPDLRPELASVLVRFDSEEALPLLKKAAQSQETDYLTYIELRNAIEALGGDAPRRTFADRDPEYDAMRAREEQMKEDTD